MIINTFFNDFARAADTATHMEERRVALIRLTIDMLLLFIILYVGVFLAFSRVERFEITPIVEAPVYEDTVTTVRFSKPVVQKPVVAPTPVISEEELAARQHRLGWFRSKEDIASLVQANIARNARNIQSTLASREAVVAATPVLSQPVMLVRAADMQTLNARFKERHAAAIKPETEELSLESKGDEADASVSFKYKVAITWDSVVDGKYSVYRNLGSTGFVRLNDEALVGQGSYIDQLDYKGASYLVEELMAGGKEAFPARNVRYVYSKK